LEFNWNNNCHRGIRLAAIFESTACLVPSSLIVPKASFDSEFKGVFEPLPLRKLLVEAVPLPTLLVEALPLPQAVSTNTRVNKILNKGAFFILIIPNVIHI
jgi:hypothetical protein